MFVTTYMSKTVSTVSPDTPLSAAKETLSTGNFRHLPVLDPAGRLTGIITDRDLRSAYPSGLLKDDERSAYLKRFRKMEVREIMTAPVARLTVRSTLDDALLLFDHSKVGALPVVDDEEKVVGILSIRDLLTAYKQLFGLGEKGSALLAVQDDGQPHPLTRLTEVLEKREIPFSRLIRDAGPKSDQGSRLIYVRVHTHNISGVHAALTAAGFTSVTPVVQSINYQGQNHA